VKDAQGNVLTGRTVTWGTNTPSIATVSNAGLVTGVSAGPVTVRATSGGQTGTTQATITLVPVASVALSPHTLTVATGKSPAPLPATVYDSVGNVLTGRAVSWTSSSNALVSVTNTGLVSGVTVGSATVTATVEGKTASSTITSRLTPVATVTV